MGKSWGDVLEQIRGGEAEQRSIDAQMLTKIAAMEELLAERGTSLGGIPLEQSAQLLDGMGIGPDDYQRLVEQYGNQGDGQSAEGQPAEGQPAAAEGQPAQGDPAEGQLSDEQMAEFAQKMEGLTEEQMDAFLEGISDDQADQVLDYLQVDREKVASYMLVEEATFSGVMRAMEEIGKQANAANTLTPEQQMFSEINGLLDRVLNPVQQ